MPSRQRNYNRFFLAFFWVSGFVLGIVFFQAAGDSLFPLMRRLSYSTVSIVSLFGSLILPFLFSAFAVVSDHALLLLPIAFGKAFLLSFLAFGLQAVYGQSGWLISNMLLFGNMLSMPLLYCFWLRKLTRGHSLYLHEILYLLCALIPIGSVYYSIIAPFLARLIILQKG